jgi:hydroxymethylglutaryl-CoA synthase
LAIADNVEVDKYLIGLGQEEMAYCDDTEDCVSMMLTVTKKVLGRYDPDLFGFLGIGTESIIDGSKSIKSIILDLFPNKKPYHGLDHHNACYGGTASLLHCMQWLQSDMADRPLGLVLCGDIATYKNRNERPTGGCGVIAMICSKNAKITISNQMSHHMENTWDFYKPYRDKESPIVNGKLSIECYLNCLNKTYQKLVDRMISHHMIFHHPYNKLVMRAFDQIVKTDSKNLYEIMVSDGCRFSKLVGNTYTASVYMCLMSLMFSKGNEMRNKNIMMYSYGSGCMSTIMILGVSEDFDLNNFMNIDEVRSTIFDRTIRTIDEMEMAHKRRETIYTMTNYIPQGELPKDMVLKNVVVLKNIKNGIRTYG